MNKFSPILQQFFTKQHKQNIDLLKKNFSSFFNKFNNDQIKILTIWNYGDQNVFSNQKVKTKYTLIDKDTLSYCNSIQKFNTVFQDFYQKNKNKTTLNNKQLLQFKKMLMMLLQGLKPFYQKKYYFGVKTIKGGNNQYSFRNPSNTFDILFNTKQQKQMNLQNLYQLVYRILCSL